MCVIVDNSVRDLCFCPKVNDDFLPLINWLTEINADGVIVYGGKNLQELEGATEARRFIRRLRQAGRAHYVENHLVDELEGQLARSGHCRSNDSHVIALAQLSGARLLAADDTKLHQDFTDKALVDNPRGKVYQYKIHAKNLLRHTSGCPYTKGKV